MVMHKEKQCPKCGAIGQMDFGYCEKCRLISPRLPRGHKSASTRRRLLKRAMVALAFYSPLKDACVALRNRIVSRATPIQIAVSDSIQLRDSVNLSASLSPFHGTFVYELIPGPHAPGGQHHGQV
jgi:hypothetical protein